MLAPQISPMKTSRSMNGQTINKRKLKIEDLRKIIQEKVLGKINGADEIRGAFSIFGRNRDGISPTQFRKAIAKLGIVLSMEDATRVFMTYDEDGNGRMDIYELMRNLLPKDYKGQTWIVKTDIERRNREHARREGQKQFGDRLFQAVRYPKHIRDTIPEMHPDKLEQMLQDKIVAGTKKATDVLRHAYYMFGRPQDGITAIMFKHQVRQLGIPATNEDCRKLFQRYDSDGNGRLDFYEFINNLMPKDYPTKPWNIVRSEQDGHKLTLRRTTRNQKGGMYDQRKYPKSLRSHRLTIQQIEKALFEKLTNQARTGMDEYRTAYGIFGRPINGVTPRILLKVLHRLGIPATDQDCNKLFDTRYEPRGSRIIMFQDMMNIMKYKTWNKQQNIPWFETLSAKTNTKILTKSHRSKPPVEPTFYRNSFQIGTPEGLSPSVRIGDLRRNKGRSGGRSESRSSGKWSGKLKMNRSSLSRSSPNLKMKGKF
eukprot:g10557.t1